MDDRADVSDRVDVGDRAGSGDRADSYPSWPSEVVDRYRRDGYWSGETLGSLLRGWARRRGDDIALVDGDLRIGYADLDRRVDRMAAGFGERGIGAGDHVLVHLPNTWSFVVVCFALFRNGATPVLALPAHRRHEIEHLARTSSAIAYVAPDVHFGFDHRELAAGLVSAVPTVGAVFIDGDPGPFTALAEVDAEPRDFPDPDPGAVALFLLSGGTTGMPKLVPRTHDDYVCAFRSSAAITALDTGSVYLAALPVAHNFTLGAPGVFGTFDAGGRVVLTASPSPDEAFPLIQRERVTFTALVPALTPLWLRMARLLPHDLSSLRLIQIGGSKLDPDTARRVTPTLGCRLQQSFGLAEGLLSQSRVDDPPDALVFAQGRPISPGDEVRIVDEGDRPVPDGAAGELLVRGPYTIRGYYAAGDYNRVAFTPDGFFRTGDLARLTVDGNLVIEGRIKDVVSVGGESVPANEVEDHLLAHPDVTEAAVVGVADPTRGERIWAFVAVEPGSRPSPAGLIGFMRDREVAAFKLPAGVEVLPALPKTPVGKIDKNALRERVRARPASSSPVVDAGTPARKES